jgi:hypothetical protein
LSVWQTLLAARWGNQTGGSRRPPVGFAATKEVTLSDSNDPCNKSDIASYARLFVNRWDVRMDVGAAGHWTCQRGRWTERELGHALAGRRCLGLYSVDAIGLSRWACLDLDDTQRGSRLTQIAERLEDPRQALLEVSRRGFHLWLFVEHAPWHMVRRWAALRAREAGLADIEVFPKGEGLNGVRAPLTRHPKDGTIYPLIDLDTDELASEPLALIASRRAIPIPQEVADIPECAASPRPSFTAHRDLVAEVERYTRLRYYRPERAVGRCPFHDDTHPSFGVVGGYWRCFAGCGSGGLSAFRARLRDDERL